MAVLMALVGVKKLYGRFRQWMNGREDWERSAIGWTIGGLLAGGLTAAGWIFWPESESQPPTATAPPVATPNTTMLALTVMALDCEHALLPAIPTINEAVNVLAPQPQTGFSRHFGNQTAEVGPLPNKYRCTLTSHADAALRDVRLSIRVDFRDVDPAQPCRSGRFDDQRQQLVTVPEVMEPKGVFEFWVMNVRPDHAGVWFNGAAAARQLLGSEQVGIVVRLTGDGVGGMMMYPAGSKCPN